ncbi:phosphatidylinositol-glycan biosynthesis class F protein [Daktulosphaira vitifoliae]|uniref:phosphatidylinositol-glycan biosynthesis class F protein n=1 Tax=Daktulosphaira vitifoliae TaxID=58002 RepID=UPI0021AA7D80|nr:phosphatidylinositol-glycan biosynthesis class F protein [Daktulosphaira vitifoliae]
MAKKNIRSVSKKQDSTNVLINNFDSSDFKLSNIYTETEANKDPDLIPHCFSSFCYLGLLIWLLLDKNYILLLDRNCLFIIATCYIIEFTKCACHYYLVSRIPNQVKCKGNILTSIFQFVISSIIAIFLAFSFAILFGAPIMSKQEGTLVFSILITSVIVTPTSVQLGSSIFPLFLTENSESECLNTVERSEKNNFRSTVLGAFIGTIVIPFDWETEWQRWPIPCSVGLICGHLLVNIYEIICWQYKFLKRKSIKKNKI